MAVLKLPGSEETDVAAGWSRARMRSSVDGLNAGAHQAGGVSVQAPPWTPMRALCNFVSASSLALSFYTLARIHQTSIEVTSDLVCCELSVNLVSSLQTNPV